MTDVFPGIIRSDATLLHQIRSFDGNLELADNAFLFTLPDLFQFVCELFTCNSGHEIEPSRENYLRFRKLLYSNPTNSQLQELGAHVEIERAKPQHDFSIYKLSAVRNNCKNT